MSKLSRLIAGCSDRQLVEQDFSRVEARTDVVSTCGVEARGNIRYGTGRTMASADMLDKRRRYSSPASTWFRKH